MKMIIKEFRGKENRVVNGSRIYRLGDRDMEVQLRAGCENMAMLKRIGAKYPGYMDIINEKIRELTRHTPLNRFTIAYIE